LIFVVIMRRVPEVLARGISVDVPGEVNDTVYEPRGVTVVIAPWNFPLAILGGMECGGFGDGQFGCYEAGRTGADYCMGAF